MSKDKQNGHGDVSYTVDCKHNADAKKEGWLTREKKKNLSMTE
jgi:hypothetical protein